MDSDGICSRAKVIHICTLYNSFNFKRSSLLLGVSLARCDHQTTKEHSVLYVFACGFDFLSVYFLIHALISLTKAGADGQQFPASIVLNFIFNWRPNRAFKVYLKIIEFEIQN